MEAEEPKAKKAKTEENPNKGKMTCKTRSGNEAPKVALRTWHSWQECRREYAHGRFACHSCSQNIKKVQEAMKMSLKKFLEQASALEVDLDGNILRVRTRPPDEPRQALPSACFLDHSALDRACLVHSKAVHAAGTWAGRWSSRLGIRTCGHRYARRLYGR